MKVLHVAPSYFPAEYWGGPIFSVYALNSRLALNTSVVLRVLTTDSAGPRVSDRIRVEKALEVYSGYDVIICRRNAGSSISIDLLLRLPKLIWWADIVHLTGAYSFPTLPTLLLAKILGKPLVWSPRGAILDAHRWRGSPKRSLKSLWNRFCGVLVSRPGTSIHTTSAEEKEATVAAVGAASAIVLRNGVEVPKFYLRERQRKPAELRLVYVGRLSPKKGIENLIEALRILADDNIYLDIFGGGEKEYIFELVERVNARGLSNQIKFRGMVTGAAKASAFQGADICVVPSYTENFCIVVAESLSYGTPVIASIGTPWSAVTSHGCGLWVANDPDSLCKAIQDARVLPLTEMGIRGRAWMQTDFSWDVIAEEMYSLYFQLVNSR